MNNELKTMLESVITEALQPIHSDLKEVKLDLNMVKKEIVELKETTARIETKQQTIFEQTAKLTEYHEETKRELTNIKDQLSFNTQKITETELEIFKLKKN